MEFFHPALAPFTIALIIMAFIAMMEIVGLLFGASISGLLDGLAPDIDMDVDLDADGPSAPDVAGVGPLSQLMAWLSVGRVPVLILFVAFLTGFGLTGLIGQTLLKNAAGFYLHGALASLAALFVALPITRHLGRFLGRIMPKEETDAVSRDTFIGKVATIIRGEAKPGFPAEAKLRDGLGTVHYVLVEPDVADAVFTQGMEIILVEKHGALFKGIANEHAALSDQS